MIDTSPFHVFLWNDRRAVGQIPLKFCKVNGARAERVRETTRSSPSKFKMVWLQFCRVHCPGHQFVWKFLSKTVLTTVRVPRNSAVLLKSLGKLSTWGKHETNKPEKQSYHTRWAKNKVAGTGTETGAPFGMKLTHSSRKRTFRLQKML